MKIIKKYLTKYYSLSVPIFYGTPQSYEYNFMLKVWIMNRIIDIFSPFYYFKQSLIITQKYAMCIYLYWPFQQSMPFYQITLILGNMLYINSC